MRCFAQAIRISPPAEGEAIWGQQYVFDYALILLHATFHLGNVLSDLILRICCAVRRGSDMGKGGKAKLKGRVIDEAYMGV